MSALKNTFAVVGSAAERSSNLHLLNHIAAQAQDRFRISVYDSLKSLPHFDPDLSINNPPPAVADVRARIAAADGILICTPEYIFSIPSGLKNLLEWCVATTVFSGKPVGLITASAHGAKGHEELQRILKTIEARFTPETALLIQGIKGKIDEGGHLKDEKAKNDLRAFVDAFDRLLQSSSVSKDN